MFFKDQIKFEKIKAQDKNVVVEQLKETLLQASKNGEDSVFIPLTGEYDTKTKIIMQFLTNEDIEFKRNYDKRQVEKKGYYDPHMAFYAETVARNGGSSIFTYMDTEYTFKGITVFL